MKRLNPLLLAGMALVCRVGNAAAPSDSPMPARAAILQRIHVFTGLDQWYAVQSIERVPAAEVDVPFVGDTAIKVTFERGKLKLKSILAGNNEDPHDDRQFVVMLGPDARELLSVTSTISKKDPDMHSGQSLEDIEKRAGGHAKAPKAYPEYDPKFTFVEALEILEGAISPTMAEQMEAHYVLHPHIYKAGRSLWVFTMRGPRSFFPEPHPPPFVDREGRLREPPPTPPPAPRPGYARVVVDAMEGKWTEARNGPLP